MTILLTVASPDSSAGGTSTAVLATAIHLPTQGQEAHTYYHIHIITYDSPQLVSLKSEIGVQTTFVSPGILCWLVPAIRSAKRRSTNHSGIL